MPVPFFKPFNGSAHARKHFIKPVFVNKAKLLRRYRGRYRHAYIRGRSIVHGPAERPVLKIIRREEAVLLRAERFKKAPSVPRGGQYILPVFRTQLLMRKRRVKIHYKHTRACKQRKQQHARKPRPNERPRKEQRRKSRARPQGGIIFAKLAHVAAALRRSLPLQHVFMRSIHAPQRAHYCVRRPHGCIGQRG